MSKPLISTKNLQKYFPVKGQTFFSLKKEYVKANKNISLDIYEGETLGIVGESGCGKSTFGRTIIQLQRQTGGSSMYYGETLEEFMPKYVRKVIKNMVKNSKNYDQDALLLRTLKEEIKDLNKRGEENLLNEKKEVYRLKKIAFEDTYYNTFRIVGGLVAHPDLNVVKDTLLRWESQTRKNASILKALRLENEKEALKGLKNSEQVKRLNEALEISKKALDETHKALENLHETARKNPSYQRYESFKDHGIDLSALTPLESRFLKKDLQIIFQDPFSSLDPRQKVGDIIGEGLLIHGYFSSKKDPNYQKAILDVMEKCGLEAEYINRYPHQFSGGQRQRIGIARALILNPKFIVADEAVSALDVSIQSQIINLLQDLKKSLNLTYLFITHDLGVVRYISDRIGVMYFGRLVELASAKDIFDNPIHPYTKKLLNAIPVLDFDGKTDHGYEITYETDQYQFNFEQDIDSDNDWVEIHPNHFVACTLKDLTLDDDLEGGVS